MLQRAKELQGNPLRARDGEIGKVKEFYFDDQHWVVRYLVVDTGGWLSGRRVLISPHAVTGEIREAIPINLSRQQVEKSPAPESDLPVSRQFERKYHAYYNWPMYWHGPYIWGVAALPYHGPIESVESARAPVEEEKEEGDPHLRSTRTVAAYQIQARDGEIGRVEDFMIDDTDWSIRYLLIDTATWWAGKKVLIPPSWASAISWHDSKVFIDLERQTIKAAPEYPGDKYLSRDYEERLHQHYNRSGYWVDLRETAPRR